MQLRLACWRWAWLCLAPFLLCGHTIERAAAEDLRLRFENLSLALTSPIRVGAELGLTAQINNLGDQPVEVLLALKLVDQADLQFETRYILPPNLLSKFPVTIPIPLEWIDKGYVEIEGTLYGQVDGRETMLDRDGIPLRQSARLALDQDQNIAYAAIPRMPRALPWWYWPASPPVYPYELIIGGKVSAGGKRSTLGRLGYSLPWSLTGWQGIDICAISDPEVLANSASLDSLRRYINTGGTVMIMIDEVPMQRVQPLLSASQSCEVVDRVQLNKFVMESPDASLSTFRESDRTVITDEPVDLVRVLVTGGEVTHTVDGWPAAVIYSQGEGRIVLTTLAARAWLTPRRTLATVPLRYSSFEPRIWNEVLLRKLFAPDAPRAVALKATKDSQSAVGREFAAQLIGNPVLPRNWIGFGLMAFTSVIVLGTGWLGWTGHWGRLSILVPSAGIITALIMIVSSLQFRRDIPEMGAALNVARTVSDGSSSIVQQQGIVHLANSREMHLVGGLAGHAEVDPTLAIGGIKRLERIGFDRWELKNEVWPPGLWNYRCEAVDHHDPLLVNAKFGADGLTITPPTQLLIADPILSYCVGQPMICRPKEKAWLLDGSANAGANRWTEAAMLENEQLRRQRVLNSLLASDSESNIRLFESLVCWDNSAPVAAWDADLSTHESTLRILPVQIETPPAGLDILVPRGLIRMSQDHRQNAVSSSYNQETGAWQSQLSKASRVALKFSVPNCLLPFESERINLYLDINAPRRTVKLFNSSASQGVLLATLESPSLPWSSSFSADQLNVDAEGNFHILFEVSERQDNEDVGLGESILNWKVESFQASCTGRRLKSLGNQ